jgi:hypothetical protein
MTSTVLLLIALLGIPLAFVALCRRLHMRRAWWFTYAAYFILSGTLGGWVLAYGLSPSGLAGLCIVWLTSVGTVACLAVGLVYLFRRKKDKWEYGALIGGITYPALIALVLVYATSVHK